MTTIHAVSFGDLDPGTWGAGVFADLGSTARWAIRHGPVAEGLEGKIALDPTDGGWRLEGEAISLAFEPSAPPQPGACGELETSDQIGRVTGRVSIGGEPIDLGCLGWHGSVDGLDDLAAISSFRWLAGWLGPSDGFSLIALRPRKARGHGTDLIAASVIEESPPPRIDDPRLSTTYADTGLPIRAGLELWPETHDEEDPGADRAPHYPRRAAGEVVADALAWEADGFQLSGSPVRWRSHGHAGPGIYLLGRRA